MAVESDADRLALLEDFGEKVTCPTGKFTGVVEEVPEVGSAEGFPVAHTVRITARTEDVEAKAVEAGMQVIASKVTYRVSRIVPSDGMSAIYCNQL